MRGFETADDVSGLTVPGYLRSYGAGLVVALGVLCFSASACSWEGDVDSPAARAHEDLGRTCEHEELRELSDDMRISTPNPECDTNVCISVVGASSPSDSCEEDSECADEDSGSVSSGLDRGYCTHSCSRDEDCVARGSSNCESGFSCRMISLARDFCCRRACVCNDGPDLSRIEAACEDRTKACAFSDPDDDLPPGGCASSSGKCARSG